MNGARPGLRAGLDDLEQRGHSGGVGDFEHVPAPQARDLARLRIRPAWHCQRDVGAGHLVEREQRAEQRVGDPDHDLVAVAIERGDDDPLSTGVRAAQVVSRPMRQPHCCGHRVGPGAGRDARVLDTFQGPSRQAPAAPVEVLDRAEILEQLGRRAQALPLRRALQLRGRQCRRKLDRTLAVLVDAVPEQADEHLLATGQQLERVALHALRMSDVALVDQADLQRSEHEQQQQERFPAQRQLQCRRRRHSGGARTGSPPSAAAWTRGCRARSRGCPGPAPSRCRPRSGTRPTRPSAHPASR